MIADLKAKADGFDKKRIYTALAALVIAGAAGHIMQRGSGDAGEQQAMTAPTGATTPEFVPAPAIAAATTAPTINTPLVAKRAEPAPTDEATPAAAEATGADEIETPDDLMADVVEEPAEQGPDMVAFDTIPADLVIEPEEPAPVAVETDIAETATVDPAPILVPRKDTIPEVTRSATDQILAVPDMPTQTAAIDAIVAAADGLADPIEDVIVPTASCEMVLDAVARDGALVAVTLSAPCNSGEDVRFETAGLKFTEQLGPEGYLFQLVPAMTETAVITAELADGQRGAVEVTLPDFADYERMALVWQGATGLQLHVLEHGAQYGEAGHIWADAPASVDAATAGTGGFVSVLGSSSSGYAADVYTYPAALIADHPEPQVSVEAQVMENTCGTKIDGQILRSNAGRAPSAETLTIAVPGCDAVGDYLVLNNLPQDLKLARN